MNGLPLWPENVYDLVSLLAAGSRLEHLSFTTGLEGSVTYEFHSDRYLLVSASCHLRRTVAAPLATINTDLQNLRWVLTHNGRPMVRNRIAASGAFTSLQIGAGATVQIVYEGATANCIAVVLSTLPIMEIVDGGQISLGTVGAGIDPWQRTLDLIAVNITGIVKPFPKARTPGEDIPNWNPPTEG